MNWTELLAELDFERLVRLLSQANTSVSPGGLHRPELGGYPRKQRQALAQKWSFTEIIRALALEIPGREAVGMLAHAYGTSSHTTHQDADGTAMIWERLRRGDERRELIHRAHASRQVRDVFTFAMLRTIATFRIAQRDIKPIEEFWEAQTPFLDELTEAERAWWAVERQYSPPSS